MIRSTYNDDPKPSPVANEVVSGGALTIAEVAKMFPPHRGTNGVSHSTVLRWIVNGTKTRYGGMVKLEAVRLGDRWLTSKEAVTRYITAVTAGSTEPTE